MAEFECQNRVGWTDGFFGQADNILKFWKNVDQLLSGLPINGAGRTDNEENAISFYENFFVIHISSFIAW